MFIAMHEEVSRFLKTCRSKNTSAIAGKASSLSFALIILGCAIPCLVIAVGVWFTN